MEDPLYEDAQLKVMIHDSPEDHILYSRRVSEDS